MWSNLQQARNRLGDTMKAIAQEAVETARELRDAHQLVRLLDYFDFWRERIEHMTGTVVYDAAR